jgi:GAF domain-containing protein
VTSDFKDVLRDRIESMVRSRLATVEAAVASARQDVESVFGRLHDIAATPAASDDGATLDQLSAEITARIGQAAAESSRLSGDLALLRDSVVDIDSQVTQADVLNALVERAYNFAPRVVLFVVKGEDAIAWAARGFEDEIGDVAVRGLSVSTRSDTLIGSVLHAQSTYLGESYDQKDNSVLLDRLGSTKPERIAGIPLRVRGKTVGILYADSYDTSVGSIGIEALELLVHSAGIIVELASLRQRLAEPPRPTGTGTLVSPATPASGVPPVHEAPAVAPPAVAEPEPEPEAEPEPAPAPFSIEAESYETTESEPVETPSAATSDVWSETAAAPAAWAEPQPLEAEGVAEPEAETTLSPEAPEEVDYTAEPFAIEVEPAQVDEAAAPEPEPAASPFEVPDDQQPTVQWQPEPPPPPPPVAARGTATAPAPGEVPPEEEKLHNDARRFARLLVSEIKLYNEQAVAEGRQNFDLYERLRDDIDRSRQMYDKRVAGVVAEKFDYFYDELVNTLAEGEAAKLGTDCPGPTV